MPNFLNNHYDIYANRPSITKLSDELESLAQQIYDAGMLRISTASEYNFYLFPMQNGEKYISFSAREVNDEKLIKKSKKILKKNLLPNEKKDAVKNVNFKLKLIQQEIAKYLPIKKVHEMAICRIIVQSAEPVIIQNLINENVYFFISFRNSISDLLSVKIWETARFSQGLQTNSRQDAAIFVSCGGNPFFNPKESNNEYDGTRAIDKLSVILAQEIGHYADIIKDEKGRNIDRLSSELDLSKPKADIEKSKTKRFKKHSEYKRNIYKMWSN